MKIILVVDDHPVNLKLVCDVLEFEGYQVERATSAESALSMLQTCLPDLILMDVGLPEMDGLTLTRRLKADPSTASITIVALTAYAMASDEAEAMAAGCDGFITKPIQIASFCKTVKEILTPTRDKETQR